MRAPESIAVKPRAIKTRALGARLSALACLAVCGSAFAQALDPLEGTSSRQTATQSQPSIVPTEVLTVFPGALLTAAREQALVAPALTALSLSPDAGGQIQASQNQTSQNQARAGYQGAALDFAALLASLSLPAAQDFTATEATRASGQPLAAKTAALGASALPSDLRYLGGKSGGLTSLAALSPAPVLPRPAAPPRQVSLPLAVVRSLGSQAHSLRRAAQPAQAGPRLAALAVQLNQQQGQLDQAHQELARLNLDGQSIRRQLATSEEERLALAQRLESKQARIDLELLPELQATRDGLLRLGQEHRALLASQDQLLQALADAQRRIAHDLEPKIQTLQEREGAQVAALFNDLDVLRFERDSALLRAQVMDQAYQQVANQLDEDLRPKIVALQGQLAGLSGERDVLSAQVQSLNAEIEARYQPMLHDLERANISLQNRNTKLNNRIEQLEHRLEASQATARSGQGRVDPAACERFVDGQADMFAAMGNLQQLFQLDQVTPKDLRPVDEDSAVGAFDFVFNDLISGWLLERRIDPFASPDQQKLALLERKKDRARWTPESSEQVLALQAASNAWLKKKGLSLSALGIPAAKGCGGRLCLTGLVDSRTRMVASYIFDRDPSVFPGAAPSLSLSQGGEDAAARVRQRRRSSEGLGNDVVAKLRGACRGQS